MDRQTEYRDDLEILHSTSFDSREFIKQRSLSEGSFDFDGLKKTQDDDSTQATFLEQSSVWSEVGFFVSPDDSYASPTPTQVESLPPSNSELQGTSYPSVLSTNRLQLSESFWEDESEEETKQDDEKGYHPYKNVAETPKKRKTLRIWRENSFADSPFFDNFPKRHDSELPYFPFDEMVTPSRSNSMPFQQELEEPLREDPVHGFDLDASISFSIDQSFAFDKYDGQAQVDKTKKDFAQPIFRNQRLPDEHAPADTFSAKVAVAPKFNRRRSLSEDDKFYFRSLDPLMKQEENESQLPLPQQVEVDMVRSSHQSWLQPRVSTGQPPRAATEVKRTTPGTSFPFLPPAKQRTSSNTAVAVVAAGASPPAAPRCNRRRSLSEDNKVYFRRMLDSLIDQEEDDGDNDVRPISQDTDGMIQKSQQFVSKTPKIKRLQSSAFLPWREDKGKHRISSGTTTTSSSRATRQLKAAITLAGTRRTTSIANIKKQQEEEEMFFPESAKLYLDAMALVEESSVELEVDEEMKAKRSTNYVDTWEMSVLVTDLVCWANGIPSC